MEKSQASFPQSIPQLKKAVKNLLFSQDIRPRKRLGQHFLIKNRVLNKIIKAAEISRQETILEVGSGTGLLTTELAKAAKKVIAVEKDPKMVEILEKNLKGFSNVKIIQGDILQLTTDNEQLTTDYKVVANIPYYLTSTLIRMFLEAKNPPQTMILMLQKEVAQRICARPPEMNLLTVSVQFYAKPEIISYVSKKSFWPTPKVDSAIIKIVPHKLALPIRANPLLFFRIVRAGFSHPRKQVLNNLSEMLKLEKEKAKIWLLKNNILPEQRAETLGLRDWINLTKSFKMN